MRGRCLATRECVRRVGECAEGMRATTRGRVLVGLTGLAH